MESELKANATSIILKIALCFVFRVNQFSFFFVEGRCYNSKITKINELLEISLSSFESRFEYWLHFCEDKTDYSILWISLNYILPFRKVQPTSVFEFFELMMITRICWYYARLLFWNPLKFLFELAQKHWRFCTFSDRNIIPGMNYHEQQIRKKGCNQRFDLENWKLIGGTVGKRPRKQSQTGFKMKDCKFDHFLPIISNLCQDTNFY